jgi:hypothetical protein
MKNARRPEGQASASGRADSTPARRLAHHARSIAIGILGIDAALIAAALVVVLLLLEGAR